LGRNAGRRGDDARRRRPRPAVRLALTRAEPLAQRPLDLSGLGEAVLLLLREDEVAVDRDLEDATVPPDELRGEAELMLDVVRQTGGSGEVASSLAVLDRYLVGHAGPLSAAIIGYRQAATGHLSNVLFGNKVLEQGALEAYRCSSGRKRDKFVGNFLRNP
jgi:hypothetical protein